MPSPDTAMPKPTRASRVSAELREAILEGQFPPGAKLNLEEARARFAVSLSTLREAISRLVAEGLVVFEDQRGFRVTPVSPADLAEVTGLLADLGARAIACAVTTADLDWEASVLAAAHRLLRAPGGGDAREWDAAFHAFLEALVSGCNMPILLGFFAQLNGRNDRYRRLARRAGLPPDPSIVPTCLAIAEAATRQDAATASAGLKTLLEEGGEKLAAALNGAFAAAPVPQGGKA